MPLSEKGHWVQGLTGNGPGVLLLCDTCLCCGAAGRSDVTSGTRVSQGEHRVAKNCRSQCQQLGHCQCCGCCSAGYKSKDPLCPPHRKLPLGKNTEDFPSALMPTCETTYTDELPEVKSSLHSGPTPGTQARILWKSGPWSPHEEVDSLLFSLLETLVVHELPPGSSVRALNLNHKNMEMEYETQIMKALVSENQQQINMKTRPWVNKRELRPEALHTQLKAGVRRGRATSSYASHRVTPWVRLEKTMVG